MKPILQFVTGHLNPGPLVCVALCALLLSAGASQALTFNQFKIPTGTGPAGITMGPDGALWFTEQFPGMISRVTTTGSFTQFPTPTPTASPLRITAGPVSDGNLWFTELQANKIGRITPTGTITEFPIPVAATQGPWGITLGSDNNLWFVERNPAGIGRVTPAGVITMFFAGITVGSLPSEIVAGPDGNLWFTEVSNNAIGRITTAGVVTEFKLPPPPNTNDVPFAIAVGSDGALWFTLSGIESMIGRMTKDGTLTNEFPTVKGESFIDILAAGPDGNLWYLSSTNAIGRVITATGAVTEFSGPASVGGQYGGLTIGPDNKLWFTGDSGAEVVGNITDACKCKNPKSIKCQHKLKNNTCQ